MVHILGPSTCLSRMGNWSKDQYIYFMSCTQNMGYNTRQNNASTWHYDQHKSLINVVICLHTRRNSWASSVSTNTFEDIWSIQYETYILNFLSWKHKESSYHKRLFVFLNHNFIKNEVHIFYCRSPQFFFYQSSINSSEIITYSS